MPKTIEQYREFLESLTLPHFFDTDILIAVREQVRILTGSNKNDPYLIMTTTRILESLLQAMHVREFLKEDECDS